MVLYFYIRNNKREAALKVFPAKSLTVYDAFSSTSALTQAEKINSLIINPIYV